MTEVAALFRRILVPLDGSPRSECALPIALSIARKARAEVHLAQVHVPDTYHDYFHCEEFEAEAKARETEYLDALRQKLTRAFDGTLHIHHLEGLVPETLTEEVAEQASTWSS